MASPSDTSDLSAARDAASAEQKATGIASLLQNKRLLAAVVAAAVVVVVALVLGLRSCGQGATKDANKPGKAAPEEVADLVRPESGPLSTGTLSVVNAEELYVRLVDDDLPQLYADAPSDLTVQVIISRADGGATWQKTYDGQQLKDSGSWTADGREIGIVLDSLRGGLALADQTDDAGMALTKVVPAGSDMVVRAVARVGDGNEGIDNDAEGEVVNSLYASLEQKDGARTAHVASLRHLQNLDASRAAADAYTAVVLDADVSFAGGTWDDPANVSPTGRVAGAAQRPIDFLLPLTLVEATNKAEGLVDGAGHTLRGLVIGQVSDRQSNTGLFGSLSCEVRSLNLANVQVFGDTTCGALAGELARGAYLHDCSVVVEPNSAGVCEYGNYQVSGGNKVGGLVGVATEARLENCTATVSVTGSDDVGGLVGVATGGSITKCGVRAARIADEGDTVCPTVSGNLSVGGLAGRLDGVAVEHCYAAVDVSPLAGAEADAARFGGLAGTLDNACELKSSYATGAVRAGAEAGGLVGRSANSVVRDSFCTGDVACDSLGGGFVGDVVAGAITGSVSYGHVTNLEGKVIQENGGFFGYDDAEGQNIDDTNAYLRDNGYNDTLKGDEAREEGRSSGHGKTMQELAVEGGGITAADKVHPYRDELRGRAFPYADTAGMGEIWGSWPRTRTARWYYASGDLIIEREMVLGSTPSFPLPLTLAELPSGSYDATVSYDLFAGWDEAYLENGDYQAQARVQSVPFHEFFGDEPEAEWAAKLRDAVKKHVSDGYTCKDNFYLDSMAPDSLANPEGFSYQVSGKEGQKPVLIVGQKLPAYGEGEGSYRALRYVFESDICEAGYVKSVDTVANDQHYYAYGEFTADVIPDEYRA